MNALQLLRTGQAVAVSLLLLVWSTWNRPRGLLDGQQRRGPEQLLGRLTVALRRTSEVPPTSA